MLEIKVSRVRLLFIKHKIKTKQMFQNLLTFYYLLYIIDEENLEKQNVVATLHRMEVVLMIENILLQLIILLFTALMTVTIIAFALIIILSIVLSK